jgi:hypothetical protein
MLPEDALAFFGAQTVRESWENLRDQVISLAGISEADYDEAMIEAEKQIGFNPDTDLFPYLGGEMLFAALPSSEGMLAAQGNIDLGGVLLVGTTDSTAMGATVKDFAAALEEQGLSVDQSEAKGLTFYSAIDDSSGEPIFAFGVSEKYLLAGSSGAMLEGLFAGETSLARSDHYRLPVRALPGGMSPLLYVDIEGTLGILREGMSGSSLKSFNDAVKFLEPVPTIVAGTSSARDGVLRSTLIIFLTPAE